VKARTPGLLFIFITLLLDVLGFGLIIPVAPRLVELLQGGGEAAAAPIVGWLGMTYALMQFVFAPIIGALSDRFGRRPVLLVSVFGSGLDYFAMAFAPTVPWLFVTRAINGISGASITAASAYIVDVTPPERRAIGFGIVGAAFGLGFSIGPLIGGVLGAIDIHYPFYAAGGITLCNWLYGLLILPESLPREHRRRAQGFRWDPLAGLANLRKSEFVMQLAIALFLVNLAQFALHATWVLYTKYRYGWNEADAGYSLCAVGIGAVIVQGGLARRLIPKLGERRSLLVGFVIGAFAYLGYGLATEGWMIYGVIAFASFGGLAMPAAQGLITKTVRPDEQGAMQGALTSMTSLATIFGYPLGGLVFAWSIAESTETKVPGAVFYTGSLLAVVALVVVVHALRKSRVEPA